MSTLLGTIIADFKTSLATKVEVGGTSVSIQSILDDDGETIPNGQYFFTIDGDNSQKEHILATVTGANLTVIKSISRQGVQTSGVAREHRVGASVLITNFAHIKYLNDLLKGTTDLDSTVPLKYDGTATIGDNKELATKLYVDNVAIASGADASTVTKGLNKMSTAPVSATEPIAVGDNDTRVPTQDENNALVGTSGTPSSTNKFVTDEDTSGTGDVLRESGISTMLYGDGSDGDETISTNTTLTEDKNYENLTVDSGVVLSPDGYIIRVKGELTLNGTIARNGETGNNGANGVTSSGAGGLGGAELAGLSANSLVGSSKGSAGGNGGYGSGEGFNGAAGETVANSICGVNGSKGGTGGDGGIVDGGAGGSVGVATIENHVKKIFTLETSSTINSEQTSTLAYSLEGETSGNTLSYNGGSSGGGGGGANEANMAGGGGGGAGSGGGVILIIAKTINISVTGTIESKGGAGGNGGNNGGGTAGDGGGGAGGSGGLIALLYNTYTNSGSITLTGGTGGTGANSGGTGVTGGYVRIKNIN